MDFLHRHGVKGFVTMNTLIFTGEMKAAEQQLRRIAAAGVDAVIIQDLGLAQARPRGRPECRAPRLHPDDHHLARGPRLRRIARSRSNAPCSPASFPSRKSSASRRLPSDHENSRWKSSSTAPSASPTPANASPASRSASAAPTAANAPRPAACPTKSSSMARPATSAKSATCSARRTSPPSISIPDLVRAGVRSFKIEGRLKSPEYVAAVTRVYRKALDAAAGRQPTIPDHRRPTATRWK